MKKKLIAILVLLLAAALVAGFFAWRAASSRIGRDRALEIALTDAGLQRGDVHDVEVDFEREYGGSVYEVGFETRTAEYDYNIDAKSGEILSRRTEGA